MKSKKIGIKISFILMIISIIMILFGNLSNVSCNLRNTLNNIGIGILGSSLVTFSISFGEYRVERKRALKKYIHEADKIIIAFRKILYISNSSENDLIMNYHHELQHNKMLESFGLKQDKNEEYLKLLKHYKNTNGEDFTDEQAELIAETRYKSVKKHIEDVMKSYSTFAKTSLEDISFAFDNLDFFFANKSLLEKTITNKIHSPLMKTIESIRLEVFHFDLYLNKETSLGNLYVCYDKIKKLNSQLFSIEYSHIEDNDFKTIYSSFADNIDDELQLLYHNQVDKKASITIDHVPISSMTINKMFE